MFEKLQDWIIDKIPAQRRIRDHNRKLMGQNKRQMEKNFDNLPEKTKRDLLKDDTLAAFMRDTPQKGDERRHANY